MPRDWDRHYADAANFDYSPEPLLFEAAETLGPGGRPGRALDLACGPGRNALYLAGLGWQVTAVDRSPVAIRLLRERAAAVSSGAPSGPDIDIRQADLERGEFTIEPESFDLVCDTLYLQRDLVPAIRAGLRPGGLFVGAMLLQDDPAHESAFRLRPGELRAWFEDWKILFYSEIHPAARILARKT